MPADAVRPPTNAGVTIREPDRATEDAEGYSAARLSDLRSAPGADYAALRQYEFSKPPRNCSRSTRSSPSGN